MSKVFIQENFFPENIYREIVQQMIQAEYIPPAKHQRDHQGSYWHTHELSHDCDVEKEVTKLIKQKFNFDINNFLLSTYTMVGASDKPRPHIDDKFGATHQCLIYMHGQESSNNGTGFYHQIEPGIYDLSIHVGFKPNRAVFFSSDVYHSPLQWAGNGSFRYSLCTFFN